MIADGSWTSYMMAFVAPAGILISLVWNFCNTIYARRVSKTDRSREFAIGEFNSAIRNPVEQRLSAWTDSVNQVRIAFMQHDPAEAVRQLEDIQKSVMLPAFVKLQSALREADVNQNVLGSDWCLQAELRWDTILDLLNGIYQDDSFSEYGKLKTKLAEEMDSLGRAVGDRVRAEAKRIFESF